MGGDEDKVDKVAAQPVAVGPDRDVRAEVDRRGEIRVALTFKVSFSSLDDFVIAYTANISRGGMLVRTDELLPVGAVVKLSLELPDDETMFEAIARVAHLEGRPGDETHDPAGMGLEFVHVGGAPLADRIAHYLAAEGKTEKLAPSPAAVSASVLVVDDDDVARNRIAQVIRDAGHRTNAARNGLDALRKAIESPPDLIITDIEMPALDGWQFTRLVRARERLVDIPVVFVTSHISDEERLRGYQLGVSDYIAKPFDDDDLALRVQRVLEHARAYPHGLSEKYRLRGELGQVSVGRVLTLLDSEKREGTLMLVASDEIATLYLRGGTVIRVDLGEKHDHIEGIERLFHVLDWTSGRFEFTFAEIEGEDDIQTPTSTVILMHARRWAEEDEKTTPGKS